ncbi:MAG: hypothetical protein MUP52_08230 [Candidatus Aminicenantes bacterium]|nr:hypothetical protein [Candidatus Aminicenantes bacterium]
MTPPRPMVVCFCGSVLFSEQMLVTAWEYAKAGIIVLGWCVLPDSYFAAFPGSRGDDGAGVHAAEKEGVKEALDELHKRKIDLADEVLVINVGGYVGDSTKSEIRYAIDHGKPVLWLEPDSAETILKGITVTEPEKEKG